MADPKIPEIAELIRDIPERPTLADFVRIALLEPRFPQALRLAAARCAVELLLRRLGQQPVRRINGESVLRRQPQRPQSQQ